MMRERSSFAPESEDFVLQDTAEEEDEDEDEEKEEREEIVESEQKENETKRNDDRDVDEDDEDDETPLMPSFNRVKRNFLQKFQHEFNLMTTNPFTPWNNLFFMVSTYHSFLL